MLGSFDHCRDFPGSVPDRTAHMLRYFLGEESGIGGDEREELLDDGFAVIERELLGVGALGGGCGG